MSERCQWKVYIPTRYEHSQLITFYYQNTKMASMLFSFIHFNN